ncbi:hypothetical protein LCGC14_1683040, partial [marine sediment metagenome]
MIVFAPNVGPPDLRQLFTKPHAWDGARQHIGAYKFYSHHLRVDEGEHDLVGPNTYPALRDVGAFRKVRDWGLQTYVETGVVKEWDCDGTQLLARAHRILDRVEDAGGRVDVLSLDEPLTSGIRGAFPRPTCYDIHHVHTVAEITATFIKAMHGRGVRCELLDAYPQHSVDRHVPFLHHVIEILDRRGAQRPVAFQLDYDPFALRAQNLSLGRVRKDLDR